MLSNLPPLTGPAGAYTSPSPVDSKSTPSATSTAATVTAQRLMAQFVTPLFGGVNSTCADQPQSRSLPTSQGHQRPVKPSRKLSLTPDALDVPAEPSRALFSDHAARQVKAWRKVKERISKTDQRRAQKAAAKAQNPTDIQPQPAPYQFADLLDREAVITRRGKGAGKDTIWRYAETLYLIAIEQYRTLNCCVLPHQMSIFTSNELLAKMFRVNLSTIYRWNEKLEALEFLQAHRHYGTSSEVREAAAERKAKKIAARAAQVGAGELEAATVPKESQDDQDAATKKHQSKARKDTVVDGMVYALRFRPGHRAKVHYEDLAHQYRDLDADRAAGRTAHAIIKQMEAEEAEAEAPANLKMHGSINPREQEWFSILRTWAVREFFLDDPLEDDPCILNDLELRSVEDVIHGVSLVREVHVTKRNALIGFLANAMTRIFGDTQYHRAYCKLLWQAWREEVEGRAGLQALKDALARTNTDRREWAGLRKPGALLMSRMQCAI